MQYATPEILRQHYIEHVEKSFYPDLEKFMLSGPLIAMVLEGEDAIDKVRRLNGATNPENAESKTIRGRFGTSTTVNCVHGSDSVASSQREIAIWFSNK
jgi:nucleoside-diphosphate kinase